MGRDSLQNQVGVFLGNEAVFSHLPGFSGVVDHAVTLQPPLEPLILGLEDTVGAGSGCQNGQWMASQLGLEDPVLFQESGAGCQSLLFAVGGVGREHNARISALFLRRLSLLATWNISESVEKYSL